MRRSTRSSRKLLIESEAETSDNEQEEILSEDSVDRAFVNDEPLSDDEEGLHAQLNALCVSPPIVSTPKKLTKRQKALKTAAARAANSKHQNSKSKTPSPQPSPPPQAPPLAILPAQPPPPPSPPPKKGRVTNKEKVHNSVYHEDTSCWSANHTKNGCDVDAAITIEAWRSWLELCTCGVGRLERGEEDHLHLQCWFQTHCGTTQTDINAMKAAWREHFSCVPTKDFKSKADPFQGNQKAIWMTGYVGKTLANMNVEPGASEMIFKGEQFTDDYIQHCIKSYMQDCPKDPNKNRTTFSRNNIMLYALNFKNRFIPHLQPCPSFARTLHIMTSVYGKYIPASNFLSAGYPLGRGITGHLSSSSSQVSGHVSCHVTIFG